MWSGTLNKDSAKVRGLLLVVASCSLLLGGLSAPASATTSVWDAVGYLPPPTAANLTKCAGQKPWPVDVEASLNKSTHVVTEKITITKPNTPCAATYWVHDVSVTDQSDVLADTHTTHSSGSAVQYVSYPTTRVGDITFEVSTGSGQGDLSCQFWYFTANAQTQPVEYGSSKASGSTC